MVKGRGDGSILIPSILLLLLEVGVIEFWGKELDFCGGQPVRGWPIHAVGFGAMLGVSVQVIAELREAPGPEAGRAGHPDPWLVQTVLFI